jgi:hypothetical protein
MRTSIVAIDTYLYPRPAFPVIKLDTYLIIVLQRSDAVLDGQRA